MRALQEQRFRYEELVQLAALTDEQQLELALCRLDLVEARVFGGKQIPAVRAFLNKFAAHPRAEEMRERVSRLDEGAIGVRYVKGKRRRG